MNKKEINKLLKDKKIKELVNKIKRHTKDIDKQKKQFDKTFEKIVKTRKKFEKQLSQLKKWLYWGVGLKLDNEKTWKKLEGISSRAFSRINTLYRERIWRRRTKKKYYLVFKDELSFQEQVDFFITIIFSLARQIPSNWAKLKYIIPNDPFIVFYIHNFVTESYITYLEWCNGIDPPETDLEGNATSYDGIVLDIYRELGRLYKISQNIKSSDDMKHIWFNFFKFNENPKFNKLFKKARERALEDSSKIISSNPKNSLLSWEKVLHGGRKNIKQCNLLREYISKNY